MPTRSSTLASVRTRMFTEFEAPCGRYTWRLPRMERVYAYLMRLMGRLDEPHVPIVGAPHIPLNWQRFIRFLHERGIAKLPHIRLIGQPAGQPHLWAMALDSRRPATTFAYLAHCSGFGHTFDIEESVSKAIGETLERYFLSQPDERELIHASYKQLRITGRMPLDLHLLPSFLPWQKKRFPELDWGDDSPVYWVQGATFPGNHPTLLPAQIVFWTYRNQSATEGRADEKFLGRASTSGCAGHFVREEAIFGALLEAIQRDGFIIYWLNSLSPKKIDTSELADAQTRDFIDALRKSGLTPTFLNVTTDIGVPSCVCVLTDTSGSEPVLAIGASAGFDERSTILQSATEALTVLNYVSRHPRYELPKNYEPFTSREIGRDERIFAWRGQEMLERFAFFVAGTPCTLSDFLGPHASVSMQEALPYVLERLATLGSGYEMYVYEAKNQTLSEIGYHVVRVIVPALMPLYLNEKMPTLDSKRLREVPAKMGYAAAQAYNPWPHPFP